MLLMSHGRARWARVRASFWFLSPLMALLGLLFARLMLALDQRIPTEQLVNSQLIISAGPAEQRAILFGLAAATLGTAGVVFSLATVPMSIAASQFGSRLLRAFLNDAPTQLVMGCFAATIVYCITVGLSIPLEREIAQLPFLATTTSVLLFIICFGSVIALIHHVGVVLQAPVITYRISRYLNRAIVAYTRPRSDTSPANPDEERLRAEVSAAGRPTLAAKTGYVDAIDGRRLARVAREHEVVILLRRLPGDFVMEGDVLALVWPGSPLPAAVVTAIRKSYLLSVQRSLAQDVGFGINQLVEIALRALSPAINDPLTAINCLDRIGDSLRLLVASDRAPTLLRDDDGKVRLFFMPAGFADLADAGLSPIRQYGRNSVMVLLRLLDVIAAVAPHAHRPEDRAVLSQHIHLVGETGEAGLSDESDRQALVQRLLAVESLLDGSQPLSTLEPAEPSSVGANR
jgi:uncharacterized membrane protein